MSIKKIENLSYYEIFEIPVTSSFFEIRSAYKDTLSIYSEDSMSTYSLFSGEEREKILEIIEKAFHVLIDEKKRAEYDRLLVDTGKIDPIVLTEKIDKKPKHLFLTDKSINKEAFFKRLKMRSEEKVIKEMVEAVESQELISGEDLKKLRLALEIKLEDIFKVARISISMLQAIEDNQFENLPSLIYLKNFLKSYAEILQLNPMKVVDGYLINLALINSDAP